MRTLKVCSSALVLALLITLLPLSPGLQKYPVLADASWGGPQAIGDSDDSNTVTLDY